VTGPVASQLDGLAWRPLRPGVDIHVLYQTGDDGPSAAVLRYQPGAEVPPHEHVGTERILVLAGEQHDDRGHYGPGTMIVNAPGTSHRVWSPTGCLVLIAWDRPVRFLSSAID